MFTKLLLIYLTINFLPKTISVKFTIDTFSDLTAILNEGKQQLDSISVKTRVPAYGECWKKAVTALEAGCRYLTEQSQCALALRLADCFLQMSGQDPLTCDLPRTECLKDLSDRAFNVYTEFYTHTQNICYFLQSKLWHEEAEKTIDKLASTSLKVTSQLAEAERGQEILLRQQKESLNLQENFGSSLNASRESLTDLMDDLKKSTIEQKLAIMSLFDKLTAFQSWAVGEVSWFDSILYYCISLLVVFLFTSTERTQRARLLLYFILSGNYLLERYVANVMAENSQQSLFMIGDNLSKTVWFLRNMFFIISATVLAFVALNYSDYNKINNSILCDLKKQNEVIVNYLTQEKTKLSSTNRNVSELSHNNTILQSPVVDRASYKIVQESSRILFPEELCTQKVSWDIRQSSAEPYELLRCTDVENNYSNLSDTESTKSDRSLRRSSRLQKFRL